MEKIDINKIEDKMNLYIENGDIEGIEDVFNSGYIPVECLLMNGRYRTEYMDIHKYNNSYYEDFNGAEDQYFVDQWRSRGPEFRTGNDATDVKNFLEFDKVYENTKIIRLEKNYRSTQNILNVASKLIENNQNRVGKKLFTNHDDGEMVKLTCYRNVKDEAIEIGSKIENLK